MKKLFFISISLLFSSFINAQSLTTASYNVRYSNEKDSIAGNGWGQRYPVIAQIIKYNDLDIWGGQEVKNNQLNDLLSVLSDYAYVGVGRDDGKTEGEYAPIFYKKNSIKLIKSGHFWLSETSEKPSVGWDAALPRICTWGHFEDIKSGKEFLFFNLHMDHIGVKARIESALLVQKKIIEIGADLPVILTGDFNVDQTNPIYDTIVNGGLLVDSYEVCDFRYALNGTGNGFNIDSFSESRIDHVFVSKDFAVKSYAVLTDTYRVPSSDSDNIKLKDFPKEMKVKSYKAKLPSDHYPVKVVLEFK